MAVEAVIFDIGNVLIEWLPERFYDRVVGEARRKAMFETVDLHAMNDRIDRGESFRAVVYETAENTPDFAAEIRMWHDNWLDLATPEIAGSVALMRELRGRGVPVFILSNIGQETWDLARGRYGFLEEFDRVFLSGPLRMAKPDHAIYAEVEAATGIAPDRLLFTDDRRDNIEIARARGWQTHLFEGAEGWRRALKGHGLLEGAQ